MNDLPSSELLTSTHRLRVRFCETDMMGIVHHANYLVYCEAARVEWLLRRGVSYDGFTKMGIHLPVVDVRTRYRLPARFEDELEVVTTVTELTRVSVRYRYFVTRGEALLCEAETLLACVGDDLRPKRMPPEIAKVFRSAEVVPSPVRTS